MFGNMMYPSMVSPMFLTLLMLILIWSAVWKAIALWKSARNNHLGWFIVFCILNTAGILEIIYIFFVQNGCKAVEKEEEKEEKPAKKRKGKK